MTQKPKAMEYQALRAPIPASDGTVTEAIYWIPNELAVTVRAPTPPTLEQLKTLSARLKRLLGDVGISVVPFYAGGQRLSRATTRRSSTHQESQAAEPEYIQVDLEVGSTPTKAWVEIAQEERWQDECKRRPNRLPGVHVFGSGPSGVAVIFYTLLTHHRQQDQRRDVVQLAVDYINEHLDLRNPGQGQLRVLAAMPNWLSYGFATEGLPTSGPGAPPMWSPDAAAPSGSWIFKQPEFAALIQKNKTQPVGSVRVILFDTASGSGQDVIAAAQNLPDYAANSLLGQVVNDLQSGKMLITDPYAAILANDPFFAGQDDLGRPFSYNMNDHGIFIAGIIRSIVPQAEIKLVRTQNPFGAGDMHVFLDALEEVGQRHDTQQIVLNLSLGLLPPLENLHQIWFGSGCCCEAPAFADALRTIEKLHLGLRLPIRSLIEKGVVIVAAAGNDSLGHNPPLGPRFPARYDDVLGVGAVNRLGEAAAYSNQANLDHWGSGIATYGGEEPNDDSDTLAWYLGTSSKQPGPPDAIHSLYLNPSYPPLNADDQRPEPPNSSGWAWWSGTSFATGVVSGLAAHHILAGLHGQQVVQAILNGLASAPYSARLQAPILEVVEE
ncbi:MAG TPA: S8/S53 family peptidase [Ktedonobacterales bacterium]|nr:S8/S53 family peptidase [Ktedonobacterales bacterium]